MKGVRLARNERVDSLDHLGRRIIQRTDGFRFSMDAVLLAHFPRYGKKCRVLDLGTGTGAIPLLMAENAAYVEALEIDNAMAGMAARSVLLNGPPSAATFFVSSSVFFSVMKLAACSASRMILISGTESSRSGT